MATDGPSVDLEISDGIATVVINNPRRRNCFTPEMFDALFDTTERITADSQVRVVVIRGAGDKAFSAGVDLDSVTVGDDYMANFLSTEIRMNRATEALDALEVPVIAGLKGACMGGGVQVAVAADWRIAADDLRFAIPAVKLGVMYPLAPIETLVGMAGPAVVKKLMIEGGEFDAMAARAAGFIEEIVPADSFDTRLAELAATIAGYPDGVASAYKRIIDDMAGGLDGDNEAIRKDVENTGVLEKMFAEIAAKRRKAREDRG